jgi:hypothetical protein
MLRRKSLICADGEALTKIIIHPKSSSEMVESAVIQSRQRL